MTRSKQKSPNINLYYKPGFIGRDYEIVPKFVGKTFKVHSGYSYVSVLVTELMIGHKFGEFVPTRSFITRKK